MKRFSSYVAVFLASPRFFWAVVALFVLQALWIAFSAVYPMAFDEAYHFTFIQLYAGQWSPFIPEHPAGYDHLGIVTRDVSYLYHYLMSFPLRLIALASANETVQIISLRVLNIGFMAAGLLLMKRALMRAGLSAALSQSGLALFTLIPIVPLLAAQINYDNLLIPVLAALFLLVADIIRAFARREVPAQQLLLLVATLGFTAVLKQAALPLLLVTGLFISIYGWWQLRPLGVGGFSSALKQSWGRLTAFSQVGLVLLVLLAGFLALERYGGNLVRYQALAPKCEELLSVEQCMQMGPFERTQQYLAERDPEFQPSLADHTQQWLRGMWYRTFFMINGDVEVDRYQNFAPLPLPALAISLVFLAGLTAATKYRRELFRDPFRLFLVLAALFYVLVLWYTNYTGYARVGRTAALNGRYLLVLAVPIAATCGLGLSRLLRSRAHLKAPLVVIALVLALQGGGVLSFILRSHETWYWPQVRVQQVNEMAESLIRPLVLGSEVDEELHFIKP